GGPATGYVQLSLSADCAGTIAVGDDKSCTITNDDQPAHLTVIKRVINNDGGTKGASDFTLQVLAQNGGQDPPGTFPGSAQGTAVTISTADDQTPDTCAARYPTSSGADCSGTIGVGQTKS